MLYSSSLDTPFRQISECLPTACSPWQGTDPKLGLHTLRLDVPYEHQIECSDSRYVGTIIELSE